MANLGDPKGGLFKGANKKGEPALSHAHARLIGSSRALISCRLGFPRFVLMCFSSFRRRLKQIVRGGSGQGAVGAA